MDIAPAQKLQKNLANFHLYGSMTPSPSPSPKRSGAGQRDSQLTLNQNLQSALKSSNNKNLPAKLQMEIYDNQ